MDWLGLSVLFNLFLEMHLLSVINIETDLLSLTNSAGTSHQ